MRRAFVLTALWSLAGSSILFAQTTPAGSLSGSTGGGRPSNGGGAVPPSTRPAGSNATAVGTQRGPVWLGMVKGRAEPGTGVDRTKAGFGGIAPGDPGGPATRPDAGLGNPSTPQTRPDAGIGNPGTPQARPDEQIGVSRVPQKPSDVQLTSRPVPERRPVVGLDRRVAVFPGAVKLPGIVNPGWATRNGNAAAPSTAAPAVAKGTIYAPATRQAPATGGYTAEPPRGARPIPPNHP